ncbi:PREDICTED: transcription factor bHLH92-like [Nelumbo nucifera]|uniref:Transcription factor bHLH92-like n=1 Tax=Nelumbo nucifera TaxID=4432 RepID=A0A1U8B493_NELNU|nr:PREDICTED: transcription factor bHLH92-like [Nelumbo nucifera]
MEDPFRAWETQRATNWPEAPSVNQSAFTRYTTLTQEFRPNNPVSVSNRPNCNKRIIELLRAISNARSKSRESETDRCYRHMISERVRRDKQRQNYEALHSILPPGTKNEKISIVRAATSYLQDLEKLKEELEKQNHELGVSLAGKADQTQDSTKKIRLQVCNPSSAIDSMVWVLRWLKSMNLKARKIESKFSVQEFSAVLEIETEIEAAAVENAMQCALMEVERKLAVDFVEREEYSGSH